MFTFAIHYFKQLKTLFNKLVILLYGVAMLLMFALPTSTTHVATEIAKNNVICFKDNSGLFHNMGLTEESNGIVIIHFLQDSQNFSYFIKKTQDFSFFIVTHFQNIAISFKQFDLYATHWLIPLSEKALLFPFHFFF